MKRHGQIKLLNNLIRFDRFASMTYQISIVDGFFRKVLAATIGFIIFNVICHCNLVGFDPWDNFSFFSFLWINSSMLVAQYYINSVGNMITIRVRSVLHVANKMLARENLKLTALKCSEIKKIIDIHHLLCELCDMKLDISTYYGMQMLFNIGTDFLYISGAFYFLIVNICQHNYYWRFTMAVLAHVIPVMTKHILLVYDFETLQYQVCLYT